MSRTLADTAGQASLPLRSFLKLGPPCCWRWGLADLTQGKPGPDGAEGVTGGLAQACSPV